MNESVKKVLEPAQSRPETSEPRYEPASSVERLRGPAPIRGRSPSAATRPLLSLHGLNVLHTADREGNPVVVRGLLRPDAASAAARFMKREQLIDSALQHDALYVCVGSGTHLSETTLTRPRSREEFARLQAEAGRGFAVISIERFGSPDIVKLKRRLERFLDRRLVVGGYLATAGQSVLPPHADNHPVIVIQIDGRKSVEFSALDFGRTVQTVLEPCDALYIPRGVQHAFKVLTDCGAHLCVAAPHARDKPVTGA